MSKLYYKEKLTKLIEKLFTHEGDAKSKFIENEDLIVSVILASKSKDIEKETQDKWDDIWIELNKNSELKIGSKVFSSYYTTIQSKRNKSLIKYLDFFLEEFYKVL